MINENKYWLVIEPYVYISINEKSVFLYNTLDGEYIESSDYDVISLIKSIKDNPGETLLIDLNTTSNNETGRFLNGLRDKFMGDLIDKSLSKGKPMQFTPILNLQNEINRLKPEEGRSIGENLISHLHEITIFLESPGLFPNKYYPSSQKMTDIFSYKKHHLPYFLIENLLLQIPANPDKKINIIAKDLFSYQEYEKLIKYLNKLSVQKKYVCHYNMLADNDMLSIIDKERSIVEINVNFPVDDYNLSNIVSLLKEADLKHYYSFLICSENDYDLTEGYIEKYMIEDYKIIPVYDGKNTAFFEANVYITKDDILEKPISMREIFIRQSLNMESFGNILINNSGDTFSNLYKEKIGNIADYTLLDILYREVNERRTWFELRNKEPCNQCHFQWLCPSPSIYETLLNKYNLCNLIS